MARFTTKRSLIDFREAFALDSKKDYLVASEGGEAALRKVVGMRTVEGRQSVAGLIKDEKDENVKRAMILWASSWRHLSSVTGVLSSSYASSSSSSLFGDNDDDENNARLIGELTAVANLVREKIMTLSEVARLAASGRSVESAASFTQLFKGFKKHGHKVPESVLSQDVTDTIIDNLAALMLSLEPRSITQSARMAGKRLRIVEENLALLDEEGKGEALAEAIEYYSTNGVSLSDAPDNRLVALMRKTTAELKAMNQVFRILPEHSTNRVTRGLDRAMYNMDFATLEEKVREHSELLAERVSVGRIDEMFAPHTRSRLDVEETAGDSTETFEIHDEDDDEVNASPSEGTVTRGAIVEGIMALLQEVPGLTVKTVITADNMDDLITKNPLASLVILHALQRNDQLDAKNVNNFLSALRTQELRSADGCGLLVECINMLGSHGLPFSAIDGVGSAAKAMVGMKTNHFETLLQLNDTQLSHLVPLLQATDKVLDNRTLNILLDYVRGQQVQDITELSAIIQKLVANNIPLHSRQGVGAAFRQQNFLEKLMTVPADRLNFVNRLLDAMGAADGKLTDKRVDMLLDIMSRPVLTTFSPEQEEAALAVISDCNKEGAPLTKHNLLEHLLGNDRDFVLGLYTGGGLNTRAVLESIGELYNTLTRIPDDELRHAKMDILRDGIVEAHLKDDSSVSGRLKHFFKDLFAPTGLTHAKVRLRDAVDAVETAADAERVGQAITQGGRNLKFFREHLQTPGQTAEASSSPASPGLRSSDSDSDSD